MIGLLNGDSDMSHQTPTIFNDSPVVSFMISYINGPLSGKKKKNHFVRFVSFSTTHIFCFFFFIILLLFQRVDHVRSAQALLPLTKNSTKEPNLKPHRLNLDIKIIIIIIKNPLFDPKWTLA